MARARTSAVVEIKNAVIVVVVALAICVWLGGCGGSCGGGSGGGGSSLGGWLSLRPY